VPQDRDGGRGGDDTMVPEHVHTPRRTPRAFTLVEILAVVVILGIAAAMVIPQMGSRDDLKAKAVARMVVADLLYAQNMSISTQTPHYVRFDSNTAAVAANRNSYRVITAPTSTNTTDYGTRVKHPVTKDDAFVVRVGPNGDSRTRDVTLDVVRFHGADATYQNEFTIGFDELGSPRVWCYDTNVADDLGNGGTVAATPPCGVFVKAGQHTFRISVERFTGEIRVDDVTP
jgi:prepilin-type N-terminal cleavage/methylation domain-containing protein